MLPQAMKCDIKGLECTQHVLNFYPTGSYIKWFKHTAVRLFHFRKSAQRKMQGKTIILHIYIYMWFLREFSKGIYSTSNNNISGGQIGKHYLITMFNARILWYIILWPQNIYCKRHAPCIFINEQQRRITGPLRGTIDDEGSVMRRIEWKPWMYARCQ